MTEEELKDRISMALKDPILQQGFECICKENAELKQEKIPRLERKIASIRGAHSVDCKKLNARTEQVERQKKRISELEKENNRLSRKCECLTKSNESLIDIANDVERLEKENSELKIQNTNANLKILEMQVAKDSHRDRARKAHEQLSRAERLITRLSTCFGSYASNIFENELLKEAEQFLKEVSE